MDNRGGDYLVLVDISSKPLYILGRLADLGCKTSGVSHLRVLFIYIFHLPQSLTEERRARVTREGKGVSGRK